MSLKTGVPPENADQIVMNAISDLTASSNTGMDFIKDAIEPPQPEKPLQVFVLGVGDVLDKNLAAAKPVGWRYTVVTQNEPTAAAEVSASDGDLQFSHFNQGPFVEEVPRALRQAQEIDEASAEDFEASILTIPSLYVMSLWMHSENEDILIPMPPTNESLTPRRPYSAEEFFESLTPAAELRADRREPAGMSTGSDDAHTESDAESDARN